MPFRLVTQEVSGNSFEPAADPGRSIGVDKNVATAIFEDGRIAHKTYTYIDNGETSSIDTGNSTYVFQNGDRLDLKLVVSAERAGGDYEVLSGTGAFEGATGTGSFYAADADWDGAYLWDGQFTLEMPAN